MFYIMKAVLFHERYPVVMKFVTYWSSLFWDVRWRRLVVVGYRRFGTMSVPSSRIKQ